ncbi:DUF2336 domain-containing protein [Bradyrhizobium sp.]|uniref:DUF2336 domain-containing protein n=1 Tax=Bradyrhizobium sp. TaxID=376 RepID=UPI003C52A500
MATTFSSLIDEIQNTVVSGPTKRQLRALTRITDLFVAGSGHYTRQQIELFDEIFKTLLEVIELRTRIKLAHHVAIDPNAPATLVRAFSRDDAIAVAGPILTHSTALSESDLVLSASTQSQEHLHAIAQRQTISEAVTQILIDRGGPIVVHAVAKNAGARISDRSFRELVARSGNDAELALHVGARPDIPRYHFLKLLETASASVCSKILAANPQFADAVQGAVTEVIDNINLEIRNASREHAKAKQKVRRLKYWKELGEANVHAAARVQNFEHAVIALSILARCPIEMAERAILGENPGMVEIIAKAAGCSWPTVRSLLLMRAADRRMSATDLDRERENFERLETRTAKRVLEFYDARRKAFTVESKSMVPEPSAGAAALAGATDGGVNSRSYSDRI